MSDDPPSRPRAGCTHRVLAGAGVRGEEDPSGKDRGSLRKADSASPRPGARTPASPWASGPGCPADHRLAAPTIGSGGGPLAGLASPASSSGLAATCRCPQEGGGGPRGPAEGSGVRVSAQPVSGGTRNGALAVCCLVQGARISSRHGANVRSLTAGFPFLCATSSRLAVSRIVGGRLTLDANISATTGECSPVRTAKVRLKGKQLALTPSFKRN